MHCYTPSADQPVLPFIFYNSFIATQPCPSCIHGSCLVSHYSSKVEYLQENPMAYKTKNICHQALNRKCFQISKVWLGLENAKHNHSGSNILCEFLKKILPYSLLSLNLAQALLVIFSHLSLLWSNFLWIETPPLGSSRKAHKTQKINKFPVFGKAETWRFTVAPPQG